jgi:hypothetical protein
MRVEVRGSHKDLLVRGIKPATFVYPYGSVSSNIERLVRSVGFSGARGSYFGFDGACTDKFDLRDIFVGTPESKRGRHLLNMSCTRGPAHREIACTADKIDS